MKKVFLYGLLLMANLALIGCGATKTMVLEPLEYQKEVKKITLKQEKNTIMIDPSVEKAFQEYLHDQLFKKAEFIEGDDIILQYRFLQMNEGNRFARWMTGGIGNCGEGSTTVEVKFIDNTQNGKEIGKIQVEGKIGSGVCGGSLASAIDGVVEEIVEYTKTKLRTK